MGYSVYYDYKVKGHSEKKVRDEICFRAINNKSELEYIRIYLMRGLPKNEDNNLAFSNEQVKDVLNKLSNTLGRYSIDTDSYKLKDIVSEDYIRFCEEEGMGINIEAPITALTFDLEGKTLSYTKFVYTISRYFFEKVSRCVDIMQTTLDLEKLVPKASFIELLQFAHSFYSIGGGHSLVPNHGYMYPNKIMSEETVVNRLLDNAYNSLHSYGSYPCDIFKQKRTTIVSDLEDNTLKKHIKVFNELERE